MKRMALVLAVVAMAGCKKGEQPSSAASVPDTSSQVMSSDTSHTMMSDDAHKTSMSTDSASVNRGADIYEKKTCSACHNIAKGGETPHRRPGGKQSGPDLAGVTERRERGWLRRWMKDPETMLQSDPIAISMMHEAKDARMPNMRLSDSEIDDLINYLSVKQ